MEIEINLLMGLNEGRLSRVEFWQIKQKESGFSPIVFWTKLSEAWQKYCNKVIVALQEVNDRGIQAIDCKIPLLIETNGLIKGEFGKTELADLRFSLFHYGLELGINNWLYDYDMENIHFSDDGAPHKLFALLDSMNKVHFTNELATKSPDQVSEFLEFHLRGYQRKIKGKLNQKELIDSWLILTKKLLPSNYSSRQKDAFLLWFEQRDETNYRQVGTHREILIAHNFKIKSGEAEFKTSSEWFKEAGQGRKEAFYTTDRSHKTKYKEPTQGELKNVILLLADFPKALQLASSELKRLQSL